METAGVPQTDSDRAILERFVLRARIVRDHSLARDIDALKTWAAQDNKFFVITNRRTGEESIEKMPVPLVPTEQLESAAARVRPLYLKADGLHYSKPVQALKDLWPDDNNMRKMLDELTPEFQKADLDHNARRPTSAPGPTAPRSNKDLAGSWIYGELVHDDINRRAVGEPLPLELRYEAAMRIVCLQMIPVLSLLKYIEQRNKVVPMGLTDSIFEKPVTVTWPVIPAHKIDGFTLVKPGPKGFPNKPDKKAPEDFDGGPELEGWELHLSGDITYMPRSDTDGS